MRIWRALFLALLALSLLWRGGWAVAGACPHGVSHGASHGAAASVQVGHGAERVSATEHEGCEMSEPQAQAQAQADTSTECPDCGHDGACGACLGHGAASALPAPLNDLTLPRLLPKVGFERWQAPVARFIGEGLERPPRSR